MLTLFCAVLAKFVEALEQAVGIRAVMVRINLHRIANDEFIRYENRHFRMLRVKLPVGRYDDQDLQHEVRQWACEAAYSYDPSFGSDFAAFLYKHVMHRCMQFWQRAWSQKQYPQDGLWIRNDTSWGSSQPVAGEEPETKTQRAESCGSPEETPIATQELVARLTPESRRVFKLVAGDNRLIEMAPKQANRYRIALKIGVPVAEVHHMFDEVSQKMGGL